MAEPLYIIQTTQNNAVLSGGTSITINILGGGGKVWQKKM